MRNTGPGWLSNRFRTAKVVFIISVIRDIPPEAAAGSTAPGGIVAFTCGAEYPLPLIQPETRHEKKVFLFRGSILYAKGTWILRGLAVLTLFFAACSPKSETYEALESRGAVEQRVRKDHGAFFEAVRRLESSGAQSEPDSIQIRRAAAATDRVIELVRDFPGTVESRLALDALSYAARDLSASSAFSRTAVSEFWQAALIDPILVKGLEFAKAGGDNPLTRMQILKALQRGMGTRATTEMFLDILPVAGPSPDPEVMQFAAEDTLLFKRMHDLILYARSLQPAAPPLWMVTGPWLLALDVPGFFPAFFALVPAISDRDMYLALRRYEPGEVYERIFRDPAPSDPAGSDAWLKRAAAAMDPLVCDNAFADSARAAGLPIFDAHYIFDDYLIHTAADSVKKEFAISLVRRKAVENAFRFTGADSIVVTFTADQLAQPAGQAGTLTTLRAERIQEPSMANGRLLRGGSARGNAYIMPIGEHSDALLRKLDEAAMPNISVDTR